MNMYGGGNNSSQAGRRPMVITLQLYNAATNMHDVDELFEWLSGVIVQNFDVQGVQFWALQASQTGQVVVRLRCMVHQENLFPPQVIANNQVAAIAGQLIQEQRVHSFEMVDNLFSQYQASLLARYGLVYCSSYILSSDMLLPPTYDAPSGLEIPTPLAVAVLLFLRRPAPPNALSAIKLVLEQAISVATSCGLLTPKGTTSGKMLSLTAYSAGQQPQLRLGDLIPKRLEDANLLKSSNPLAGTIVIADKQARRLFTATDGRRNVSELSASINLDLKEAYKALQILVAQHRIQLYEPGGDLVDSSVFLDNL
jgi:hypothetical protein